jgi:vacuolar-type H+-ATPase subunit C/Vma6
MTKLARRTPQQGDSPGAGERAYAYAKACGIIGRSFVGKRVSALRELKTISELEQLVFTEDHREMPNKELMSNLEKRIDKRAIDHIMAIMRSYTEIPELFIRQLRVYEYNDLKTCLHYLAEGSKTLPLLSNIGRFARIHFEAYPDMSAMLRNTEFKFILSKDIKSLKPDSADFAKIEIELDTCYYLGLTEALSQLTGDDRDVAQRILSDEVSLRNCVWALRLRTYYKKSVAETGEYLMKIVIHTEPGKNLSADAERSLELPLDSRAPWRDWKWEKFLNPEKSGEHWVLDPRYFQNAASKYLYHLALSRFRHDPESISTIFCYIKLKMFEEDLLTSIVEGLGMGMSSADVFDLLEVPA